MKTVFVDTSGFYACLDRTDSFHPRALAEVDARILPAKLRDAIARLFSPYL
jgi:hypothetical protein